jgi:hypothetical protein
MPGLATKKKFRESDADPEQLRIGIRIEMEHTDKPAVAKAIALDHLAEHPRYYTHLIKMERDMRHAR